MKKQVEKLTIYQIFDLKICFFPKNALSLPNKSVVARRAKYTKVRIALKLQGKTIKKRREDREAISSRFFCPETEAEVFKRRRCS